MTFGLIIVINLFFFVMAGIFTITKHKEHNYGALFYSNMGLFCSVWGTVSWNGNSGGFYFLGFVFIFSILLSIAVTRFIGPMFRNNTDVQDIIFAECIVGGNTYVFVSYEDKPACVRRHVFISKRHLLQKIRTDGFNDGPIFVSDIEVGLTDGYGEPVRSGHVENRRQIVELDEELYHEICERYHETQLSVV